MPSSKVWDYVRLQLIFAKACMSKLVWEATVRFLRKMEFPSVSVLLVSGDALELLHPRGVALCPTRGTHKA